VHKKLDFGAVVPAMLKPSVKRSACDACRAKRVRCLRAQDSTASCARCSHLGVRCVTSAARHPGRPPKHRDPLGTATTSPADTTSPAETSPGFNVPLPTDALAQEAQTDPWVAPDDFSALFGMPEMDGQSQLQELFGANENYNAIMQMDPNLSGGGLGMHLDPLLEYRQETLGLTLAPQSPSAKTSLTSFREGIDQRIARFEAYYAEPAKVLERCKEEGAGEDVENPAALLLTCTKDFIQIIQKLTTADRTPAHMEESLSTEVLLLALSGYLAFMRFFDSLFYRIYEYLCQIPPETYKSIKVKSVLRIGGVTSLQDISLGSYATGILDAIHCEVQTLERLMGIPVEYCLSPELTSSPDSNEPGLFSRADRAQLFAAVMAQEDIRSQRESKSFVESARAVLQGINQLLR
jgi:hypothetical protein